MIFITLGSQKFQFNRLLKKVDELLEKKIIKERVFAQVGYSDYVPKNYSFEKFIDRTEFIRKISEANIVITHGGTGAIITAVKANKKVIAVPRLKEYGEHVDNHQLQIVKEFDESGIIQTCYNIEELSKKMIELNYYNYIKYKSNTKRIVEDIDKFINYGDNDE